MNSPPAESAPADISNQLNEELTELSIASARSDGVRRWTIILRSGAEITFDAAWNTNARNGPAQMIQDHFNFLSTGAKPAYPWPYRFPETNSNPREAAIVSVDIAEVQAIVQTFGK